ncbi:MAG: hypothetical protein ACXVBB_19485 [Isosphaeraceae bacterium]
MRVAGVPAQISAMTLDEVRGADSAALADQRPDAQCGIAAAHQRGHAAVHSLAPPKDDG